MRAIALRILVLLMLAPLLLPAAAGAVLVTTYTDEATFQAATTGLQMIDFEGMVPYYGGLNFDSLPLTLYGVRFQIDRSAGNNGHLWVYKGLEYLFTNSVLSSENSTVGDDNVLVTLPTGGVTALGMRFGSFYPTTAVFLLSTGETFTIASLTRPDFGFIGFTSTTPIDWIRISDPAGDSNPLILDDFQFGAALPVSEPGTPVLLCLGLVAIAGFGKRRS
jgi:hypothetical protein